MSSQFCMAGHTIVSMFGCYFSPVEEIHEVVVLCTMCTSDLWIVYSAVLACVVITHAWLAKH